MSLLPILPFKEEIVSSLLKEGRVALCAPPGSGKSTLVPQFFLDHVKKQILVLQPRRLAARSGSAVEAEDGAGHNHWQRNCGGCAVKKLPASERETGG